MRAESGIMKYRLPLMLVVFLAFVPAVGLAAHEEGAGSGHEVAPSARDGQQEAPRRGRLRFRDGPVCMCSLGMSEQDIERAQEERRRSGWRRN